MKDGFKHRIMMSASTRGTGGVLWRAGGRLPRSRREHSDRFSAAILRPAIGRNPVARVNGAVLTDRDLAREIQAIFPYAQDPQWRSEEHGTGGAQGRT